jgi:CheY-like chemotaxis protein
MVREVVQGMLNAAGFHALSAENGAVALAIFASQTIDGAIIDVDMPGMNGVDVSRALHAQAAALHRPLLTWMMTGVVRPELIDAARISGSAGILAKPFTRAELLACFDTLGIHAQHALAS